MNELSPEQLQEAARELLIQDEARDSLLIYTCYMMPNFSIQPHHRLIAEKLEEIERGDIRRLIVTMPPRFGKTELICRKFPSWVLGRNPAMNLIGVSYGDDFASEEIGRPTRNIIKNPRYSNVFEGVRLADDSQAQASMRIANHEGSFRAIGMDGQITGRGAHIKCIDDPIKNEEEAQS